MPRHQATSIDLSFRPTTYFWALDHNITLASDIKGAQRKTGYERLLRGGENQLAGALIDKPTLDPEEVLTWGRIHPSFMGGEYLPSRSEEEVEIARITIASTTMDVTSVYAKRVNGRIQYRVVDEYEGDTLTHRVRSSIRPLSLRQLVSFFLSSWDLFACLEVNFWEHNYPRLAVHRFIVDASSSFYAEFGDLIHQQIDTWLDVKWAAIVRDEEE